MHVFVCTKTILKKNQHGEEGTISSTYRIRSILDAKYEKADLNQVMDNQCQHLRPNKLERLLYILRNFESMFDGTLCTWKTPLVDLELKDDATPVC